MKEQTIKLNSTNTIDTKEFVVGLTSVVVVIVHVVLVVGVAPAGETWLEAGILSWGIVALYVAMVY
jgi:hypothetical protein